MQETTLRVTVTADLDTIGNLSDLVPALQKAGLQVDQILERSGIVTGRVRPAQRDSLARVPGVLAVEAEGHIQLPPPEAEIM